MFTHEQIWRGIDRLAAHAQTSPSGLARRAGLDSTTFNPSKRISADGSKLRWPSTESLSKALSAANLGFNDFAALVSGAGTRSLPAMSLAEGAGSAAFDSIGQPAGPGWSRVPVPDLAAGRSYALRIEDDAMAPVYRAGTQLVIAPEERPRIGDRVMVKNRDGQISAWELGVSSVQSVTLISLNPLHPDRQVPLGDVLWIARIVWASQ